MRRYYYDDDDDDEDDDDYYNRYGYYKPSKPKAVKNGIKAKTKRGQSFGSTWWSKRWIGVLESFGWDNRLQRGRNYARQGQVIDIDITKGKVISHVQGSQSKPYKIEMKMKQIPDKDWDKAAGAMSEQAIFAAKLLAGEMPQDIEDAFKTAGLSLFPSKSDLDTDCSCPDYANPCKHIAAVYYLLGERFDEDPFLIFLLRGRSKKELMDMLRSRRAEQPSETEANAIADVNAVSVEEIVELKADFSFWELKEPIDSLSITIDPPEVEMAVFKRLGDPPFWKAKKQFLELFRSTYVDTSNSVK